MVYPLQGQFAGYYLGLRSNGFFPYPLTFHQESSSSGIRHHSRGSLTMKGYIYIYYTHTHTILVWQRRLQILPSLGLLPDVVFETSHQALGRWDWLQQVWNSLQPCSQFKLYLRSQRPGKPASSGFGGWTEQRGESAMLGWGTETMWICFPAAGTVSWLFPTHHA